MQLLLRMIDHVFNFLVDRLYTIYTYLVFLVSSLTFTRYRKIEELRQKIYMIMDRNGHSNALQLFEECVHICIHYRIAPEIVGFSGGYEGLRNIALISCSKATKNIKVPGQETLTLAKNKRLLPVRGIVLYIPD